MIASAIGVRPRADGVVSKKPRGLLVDIMADRFLLGSTTAIRSQRRILLLRTHSTELKGIVTLLGLWAGICGRKCPS